MDQDLSNESIGNKINLQVGDIIKLTAPQDNLINDKPFLIKFINSDKIILIGQNKESVILEIDENGDLKNESIESIGLLNRNENASFAKQNNLIPGKWIDIHFNTEVPSIVTGEITALDEDQIEIKLTSGETIYIDFAYQGLPEDLPIEKIILRNPPTLSNEETSEVEIGLEGDQEKMELDEEDVPDYKERIKDVILEADQIKFGDELEKIPMIVEVPESEKRYSIEQQTTDLLNELLSTIPNSQRTQFVINNIHKMIERYKLLRTEFSVFDKNGHAMAPKVNTSDHKPLIEELKNFNHKLYWLLPVVKNSKKLYDICCISDDQIRELYSDVTPEYLAEIRAQETEIIQTFKEKLTPDQQNGYLYMIRQLNPYCTPFNPPASQANIISTNNVNCNMHSIVDNIGNFESSIAKGGVGYNVLKNRFYIQNYNLGINTINIKKVRGSPDVVNNVVITKPDMMFIKSFLTLPAPAVLFSKINLPSTTILNRCNLSQNFLLYWKLLKKNTSVMKSFVGKEEFDFSQTKYLTNITEYLPNEDIELSYEDYLNNSIPKTRIIFDNLKDHMEDAYTFYKAVSYLEPFMIYEKDLTYKQYQDITEFVDYKINKWKRIYTQQKQKFYKLLDTSQSQIIPSLFNIFKPDIDSENKIKENYKLSFTNKINFYNGELIRLINLIDFGKYFTDMIASLSLHLMNLKDPSDLNLSEIPNQPTQNNECNKKVLAKKYLELDELEADNGKEIKFDKNYDKTYYEIINEYQDDLNNLLSVEEKISLLTSRLMDNVGMNQEEAKREAEALINNYKLVKDGDYALLIDDEKSLYYKRKDNTWVKDNSIDQNLNIDDNNLFCNISNKCIAVNDNCLDIQDAKINIDKAYESKIIQEFDNILTADSKVIEQYIINNTNNAASRILSLIKINYKDQIKHNQFQFKLGLEATEVITEACPYSKLLSFILQQSDFVKRQNDISKFVAYFTRPAYPVEDEWWLYCKDTNVKLLPTFIAKLANVFVQDNGNYLLELDKIKLQQGVVNEADIIDKYSGWYIGSIELSQDEGYDDQGFVIKTREILKQDIGEKIKNAQIQPDGEEKTEFKDPNSQKIYNVMRAISRFMGLDTQSLEGFVVSQTTTLLSKVMPTKQEYEEGVAKLEKKGKKKDSYEITYDQNLILITLSYLLIAIQTSVPALRTKKTFPGCIRSFSGYPCFGNSDKTALQYIACITNSIKKSPSPPWNSIKKLKADKIASKMEKIIDMFINDTELIKQKIKERLEYDEEDKDDYIPIEHKIENWNTFLPPLSAIKITIEPMPESLPNNLIKNFRIASDAQFRQIDIIRTRIIYCSLSIQESVQKVVTSNINETSAILANSADVPYLENACCYDTNESTFDYFKNRDNNIGLLNSEIFALSELLEDINDMSSAPILFNPEDTRVYYPKLNPEFDEETIYRAFIVYCKYNSNIPLDSELRSICMERPNDFDVKSSIENKIETLKSNNINYDNRLLEQLMSIVNQQNIVKIPTKLIVLSNVLRLQQTIETLQTSNSDLLPPEFLESLLNYLSEFESGNKTEKFEDEDRNLKNYLGSEIKKMNTTIQNFIKQNSNMNKREIKRIIECLIKITEFKEEPGQQEMFKMVNFMKNSMQQISQNFPNIIINKVNYQNIKIPPQWNLSDIHEKDIINQASDNFKYLLQFYDDENITLLLKAFQINSLPILNLVLEIIYIKPEDDIASLFDETLIKQFMKYYLYNMFVMLISLVDEDEFYKDMEDKSGSLEEMGIREDDGSILEIITGEKKSMSNKVANMITGFLSIICNTKKLIDLNYSDLIDKVTRSKEKEKDLIVEFLTDLTDEQREIENLFKNFRMGDWSVGLQKGYREYDPDTYDKERRNIEERTLLENKINKKDDVTKGLMDIYALEAMTEQITNDQIYEEDFTIEYNGEDNNITDDNYDDDM